MSGRRLRLTAKAKMQQMVDAYQKQAATGLAPTIFEVITVIVAVRKRQARFMPSAFTENIQTVTTTFDRSLKQVVNHEKQ